MSAVREWADATPTAASPQKVRYSPGRRALSSRSVNSVWLARHTPSTADKQNKRASAGPVRAFSKDEHVVSPFASPAVGWIQCAVLRGVTPDSNAVVRSPSSASPESSVGGSPALQWMGAADVGKIARRISTETDDTAIEQAVADTLRDIVPASIDPTLTPEPLPVAESQLSTPIDAGMQQTPPALHPTVSASGGFEIESPVPQTQSPNTDILSTNRVRCDTELTVPPSVPISAAPQVNVRSDSLPWYSCTVLGFREVCVQDPLHPAAFSQSFGLYTIEVAIPDSELGRANLIVAEKRFSEFLELNRLLRLEFRRFSTQRWIPNLPPKRLWSTRANVIAERQLGFQNYLDWVVMLEAESPRRMLLEWLLPTSMAGARHRRSSRFLLA